MNGGAANTTPPGFVRRDLRFAHPDEAPRFLDRPGLTRSRGVAGEADRAVDSVLRMLMSFRNIRTELSGSVVPAFRAADDFHSVAIRTALAGARITFELSTATY